MDEATHLYPRLHGRSPLWRRQQPGARRAAAEGWSSSGPVAGGRGWVGGAAPGQLEPSPTTLIAAHLLHSSWMCGDTRPPTQELVVGYF